MKDKYTIAYLSLECLYKNSATYVHISEIIQALQQQHLNIVLYSSPINKKIKKTPLGTKIFNYLRIQANLIRNIKSYDLIYVRSHYAAFPVSLVAKLLSIPIIQEVNGPYCDIFITYPFLKIIKFPMVFLQRFQYKHATHLIGVTDNLAKWLATETKHDRITVVSNGANIKLFKPISPNSNIKTITKSPYVVFYGSMAKWHDIETAINATLDPAWPVGIKLVIIGESLKTKDIFNNQNNNSTIIFLGEQEYKKMPSYISPALAGLVIIADPEGRSGKGLSPLKLYETLSCGVPVIVSDFPGQAELILLHKCGLVVPPYSSSELAQAIATLAHNNNLAKELGKNGRKIIEKEYSWEKAAFKIHILISKLLNN
jgi:glycosyltransferase involved in cell wall biosynthesis